MKLRSWGLKHLVTSWVVYWVLLLAVLLAPVARQWWELERGGGHGTITQSYAGGGLAAVLLFVGPPLVLTLLWLASRPRHP